MENFYKWLDDAEPISGGHEVASLIWEGYTIRVTDGLWIVSTKWEFKRLQKMNRKRAKFRRKNPVHMREQQT